MPLESLAQAMNRISAEVRGGPLSRMAEGGPVMKAYEPSWRDRLARALMGDERASPERRNFVQGLMGSTGLGTTGLGVADVLPGGQALAAQEALREGDYKGAALAAVPIPGARGLSAVEREALRITNPIRAYHGSPHDFDRFDLSKIGTGEGAQAYGHGLYFAESEPVARGYRDALAPSTVPAANGQRLIDYRPHEREVLNFMMRTGKSPQEAAEFFAKKAKEDEALFQALGGRDAPSGIDRRVAFAQEMREKPEFSNAPAGRMYEVNIHADPDAFLDWDKPLRDQPSEIQRAIGNLPYAEAPWVKGSVNPIPALEDARSSWMQKSGIDTRGNQRHRMAVSQDLREAGVPGIKYLDAGSRGAGEGSRNYVVFDDRVIEIARKYGIPLAAASALLYGNQDQAIAAEKADEPVTRKAKGGAVENEEKDLMDRLRGHLKGNMVDKLMKDLRRVLRDHYVRGRS